MAGSLATSPPVARRGEQPVTEQSVFTQNRMPVPREIRERHMPRGMEQVAQSMPVLPPRRSLRRNSGESYGTVRRPRRDARGHFALLREAPLGYNVSPSFACPGGAVGAECAAVDRFARRLN